MGALLPTVCMLLAGQPISVHAGLQPCSVVHPSPPDQARAPPAMSSISFSSGTLWVREESCRGGVQVRGS